MAYLPGVPNVGPAPVSTAAAHPGGGHIGSDHGSRVEQLGSVVGRRGAGITTVTGGDPMAHSMNHYGKKSPFNNMIRGGAGAMRHHVLMGGLSPIKVNRGPGPSNQDYSMFTNDTE